MSDTPGANRSVVTAMLVAGGVLGVSTLGGGSVPKLRAGIGILFAGVALAAMAEVEPDLAQGLAWLFALSVLFARGGPAFDAINRYTAQGQPPAQLPAAGGQVGGGGRTVFQGYELPPARQQPIIV